MSLTLSFFSLKAQAEICNGLSGIQKDLVEKNFGHNPFEMITSLVQIASGDYEGPKKNLSLELSFDLPMVYQQTLKLHQSKTFKEPYMSFIKSSFFGFYRVLYKKPSKALQKQRFDFLSATDRQNLKRGSVSFTGFDRSRCTRSESKNLGCSGHYYKVTAMIYPELSCPKGVTSNGGFEVEFYLSHNRRYGFKIVDVNLSGKRIVLDLFEQMSNLKSRGYNNSALSSQLKALQPKSRPFNFPKRLQHSNNIMAIIQTNQDRLPTSL